PIVFLSTILFKSKSSKIKIPYFIGLFVLAMATNTYSTLIQEYSSYLVAIAKSGLTLTLFLIGCGLSREALQSVGLQPFIQGVALWLIISTVALLIVIHLTQ